MLFAKTLGATPPVIFTQCAHEETFLKHYKWCDYFMMIAVELHSYRKVVRVVYSSINKRGPSRGLYTS